MMNMNLPYRSVIGINQLKSWLSKGKITSYEIEAKPFEVNVVTVTDPDGARFSYELVAQTQELQGLYVASATYQPVERTQGMNYSTAVFLINKNMRAVIGVYEPDDIATTVKGYGSKLDNNRKMFKTLDPSIKKDDYVVVPTGTRHGMTVVKITEVDVLVDFDDPTQVQWVIAKVDRSQHEEVLKQEAEAIETVKRAEFRKRRNSLLDAIDADQDELRALPMYANGDNNPKQTDPLSYQNEQPQPRVTPDPLQSARAQEGHKSGG